VGGGRNELIEEVEAVIVSLLLHTIGLKRRGRWCSGDV
jgi:hypothetical protein